MIIRYFKHTFSLVTVGLSLVTGATAAQAAGLGFSVIADGLDNPRNLAFGADGSIYVTESGTGGDGEDGRCIPSPSAGFIPLCAGNTGKLTKINPDGTKVDILSNLPSLALTPFGEQAAGPADIQFDGAGNAYFLYGFAGDPSNRETVLNTPILGQLYKLDLNSFELTSLADFAEYELENNPDGSDIITNPYAMTIVGNNAYVIDGGGNAIYSVGLDGSGINNVAGFPDQPLPSNTEFPPLPPDAGDDVGFPTVLQSVPTAVTVAPDGSLTVAEYSGFPYPEGSARIFSVDPTTLQAEVLYDGFTQLTGATYDDEGNLYVLQHMNVAEWKAIEQGGNVIGDIGGSIIKIAPDGTQTTLWSGNGLEAASGLFFGPDGRLYTSNRARLADLGQVVAIDPQVVPEPNTILGVLLFGAGTRFFRKVVKDKQQSNQEDI
ncbi:conserved hypothetical protein [Gloeothece citriformis PCC 7424]|uniref:ScyD/ScyE family protein n=1 Tax=Gloeothece citriformis (strain PCC 7424) TaxID=65393 RepID=B7KHK8_GLOC7|nr:ScyD/ScyE family protein [Gloeothece citriformis]ACK70703.1 conserved hypothetical protein [Gloeothece citriformis PCC 7424]